MPDTGAPWNLSYPTIGEQADVPGDMGELAGDVHAALEVLSGRLGAKMAWGTGSVTPSGDGTNTTGAAITLPTGRFSVAPLVFVVPTSGVNGPAASTQFAWVASVSASAFTPQVKRSGSTAAVTFAWLAVGN